MINADQEWAEGKIEEKRSKEMHKGASLEREQKGRAQGSKSSRRNYQVSEEQDVHRVIIRVSTATSLALNRLLLYISLEMVTELKTKAAG